MKKWNNWSNEELNFTDDQKEKLLALSKQEKMSILMVALSEGLPVFLHLSSVFLSVPPEEGGIPPEVIDDLGDNRHAITDQLRERSDKPVKEYIKEYDNPEAEEEFYQKYKDRLDLKRIGDIEDEEFDDSENNE